LVLQEITCENCRTGPHTIYGPTFRQHPDSIQAKRSEILRFKAHQTILRADEAARSAYIVRSGWAYRAAQCPDGRRQILSFFVPGDTINIEAVWVEGHRVPFAVRALTDIELCSFEAGALKDIVFSDAAQQHCFAAHVQHQIAFLEHRLLDVGRRRAVARIARLVLDLEQLLRSRGLADGDVFDFPLRQEDIGDALGMTASHINRTLAALRQRGILSLAQGRAHILNRDELEKIADNE
jgi:CRP-like cAMP-binding protein